LFLSNGTARLKSLPIGTGIWPERRLLEKDREDDFERAPRSVGMVPLRPFPMTEKASRPAEVGNPTGMSLKIHVYCNSYVLSRSKYEN
jgi:hypothetical protein